MIAQEFERLAELIRKDGLEHTANYLNQICQQIDPAVIFELLAGPNRFIHLPILCILRTVKVLDDEISRMALDDLQKDVEIFQEKQQMSDEAIGNVLDRLLGRQIVNPLLKTVEDLINFFNILQTKNAAKIFFTLEHSSTSELFWNEALELSTDTPGLASFPEACKLCTSGNIATFCRKISHYNKDQIGAFMVYLNAIQKSSQRLSEEQWLLIINRNEPLYQAVLEQTVLNWLLEGRDVSTASVEEQDVFGMAAAFISERKWNFHDISRLFRFLKSRNNLIELLDAMSHIYEGKLPSTALDSLSDTITEMESFYNDNMVFEESQETSRTEAIRLILSSDYMKDLNPKTALTETQMKELLEELDFAYSKIKRSGRLESSGSLPWVEEAIGILAVEKYYEKKKVQFRDVQKLAVLLGSKAGRVNSSRILQMNTGEGKTFVVAALAIAEVKHGHKVDIITTTSELAVSQSHELQAICQSVGITVSHNCVEKENKEKSEIYKADIVYGTPSAFMFDVIYEEFWGKEFRHARGFDMAIVDEADSQLLDLRFHQCIMSTNASGMANLMSIQTLVWSLIAPYFEKKELKKQDGIWILTVDGEEKVVGNDFNVKKFFVDAFLETVEKATGQKDGIEDKDRIRYPTVLKDLVKSEIPKWIESAVTAFLKTKDFDYVIEDKEIVIVDSGNTGARNKGTRWSYGLHQFLQLRHAMNFEPENLTTCYLSTVSFCLRYKRLFGLTGTVGSEAPRKFMRDVYRTDFIEIPPFKKWRHIPYPHILCSTEEEWLNEVVKNVLNQLKNGRAVLLVTQFIHFADELQRRLSKNSYNILSYTSGAASHVTEKELQPGTCIVATNIAGRGTDLKISKAVENRGGLHVVLSSFPENDRVERQNIGRASRTGERGTSQMVLNLEHLPSFLVEKMVGKTKKLKNVTHKVLVDKLKDARDEHVLASIKSAIKHVDSYKKADEGLTEFITIRNKVVEFVGEKNKDGKDSYEMRLVKTSLNTRFGRFLSKREHGYPDKDEVQEEFGGLEKQEDISKYFDDYVLPVYLAWNQKWDPNDKDSYGKAWSLSCRAIDVDSHFAGGAYYVRGLLLVKAIIAWPKQKENLLERAVRAFVSCREVVERLQEQYNLMAMTNMRNGEKETLLAGQMKRMGEICDTIIGNVNHLIGRNVDAEIKKLQAQIDKGTLSEKDVADRKKYIAELEENKDALKKGLLGDAKGSDKILKIQKYHKLIDCLPKSVNKENYMDEIDAFNEEGYLFLVDITVTEKTSIWNVLAVAGLGLLQLIGGAALTVFTGGLAAKVGMDLMIEGAFDLYAAVKMSIDGQFSWEEYGIGKLISIVCSVVALGFSGMKQAFKGLTKSAKAVKNVANKTISQSLKTVPRESLKYTAKQAGKGLATAGGKLAANEIAEQVAGDPLREALSSLLKTTVKEGLHQKIRNNDNLHRIVEEDNQHNDRTYSSRFLSWAYNDFLESIAPSFLKQLRDGFGNALQQNMAHKGKKGMVKLIKTSQTWIKVVQFLNQMSEFFHKFDETLRRVVESIRKQAEGESRYEDRLYEEQRSGLTADQVIGDLAGQIADVIADRQVQKHLSKLSHKLANKAVERVFKKHTRRMNLHKEGHIFADDVDARAKKMVQNSLKDEKKQETLEKIIRIARRSDEPGDSIQAKALTKAVQQPIEIVYRGADGKMKVKVLGKEFSDRPAIKLYYEVGQNGQVGHYSLADGRNVKSHGSHTCLQDAVAAASGYNAQELKQASANYMLNRVDKVIADYEQSKYSGIILDGGVRAPNARNYGTFDIQGKLIPLESESAQKHVFNNIKTFGEAENAFRQGQNIRAQKNQSWQKQHTIVCWDRDAFERSADAQLDKTYGGTRPPHTLSKKGIKPYQHRYLHDKETTLLKFHCDPNTQQITKVEAFRAKPVFCVEYDQGMRHYDHVGTIETPNTRQTIWDYTDPTPLSDLQTTDISKRWPYHI